MFVLKCVFPIFTLFSLVPVFGLSNPNSDVCVTNNLEGDSGVWFSVDAQCTGWSSWQSGTYEALDIVPSNPSSTTFVYAESRDSCVRSNQILDMTAGSMFQFNLFINDTETGMPGGVDVYADFYSLGENGITQFITRGMISSTLNGNGWHDLRIQMMQNVQEVYIVLYTARVPGSRVLLDSYRYVSSPALLETCKIYPAEEESSEEVDASSEEDDTEDSSESSEENGDYGKSSEIQVFIKSKTKIKINKGNVARAVAEELQSIFK